MKHLILFSLLVLIISLAIPANAQSSSVTHPSTFFDVESFPVLGALMHGIDVGVGNFCLNNGAPTLNIDSLWGVSARLQVTDQKWSVTVVF